MVFDGKIRLNLDNRGYAEKPGAYVGAIRNRLCAAASIRDLTLDQLMEAIQRGYTYTPAAMTGTTGDTWKSQQIICADIDNDTGRKDSEGHKIMLDPPMLPAEALEAMKRRGIVPCFMYYTFSNTETWPKYRAVVLLDQPLTDAAEANDLTARFAELFNAARPGCADMKIRDSARLLYGGRPGSVFYASRQATDAELLRSLPAVENAERAQDQQPQQLPAKDPRQDTPAPGALHGEAERFDLAAYIRGNEYTREVWRGSKLYFNPCPICGHNDCFQVTGPLWHCWSNNHTGTAAGTIIDYLQRRDNISLSASMYKFENEILHPVKVDFSTPSAADPAERAQDLQPQQPPAKDPQPVQNDGISSYIRERMAAEIETFASTGAIKTGFSYLDNISSGGLFPGLYAIGATSSLGKTTLMHQIADQIAASGQEVLFFSLEQSRLELASKSLARMTARADYKNALTSLQIRQGAKNAILDAVIKDYSNITGDRLSVIEGGFRYTVEALGAYVARYIRDHATGPVVIVDYLQILNTEQKTATRKDEIDHIVSTLKIMSAQLQIPVIVISSVNRANYLYPVDFESFKESGGIEYTADVVFGLQLACLEEKLFESSARITEKRDRIKQAKSESPRTVQLVCLKNRYGKTDWKVEFKYYPQFDLFTEYSGTFEQQAEQDRKDIARELAKVAKQEKNARLEKSAAEKTLKQLAYFVSQMSQKDEYIDPLS